MIVECKKCQKIQEQKEIAPTIYECGFCHDIYKITDTIIRIEPDDVQIQIADSKDDIMNVLPPELMQEFSGLELKLQRVILYSNVLKGTQKSIAEQLGMSEHVYGKYLKNAIVKKILTYLTFQTIQENSIRQNLKISELNDKMYDWMNKVFDGDDNILKERVSKILTGISDSKTNYGINKTANKKIGSSLL